jgi:hypothetical protein
MYDEYRTPKVKFVANINLILAWVAGILAVCAAIFGITVGILSTNVETIDNRLENDCLAITYEEDRAFGEDEDLSGVYCKVDPDD